MDKKPTYEEAVANINAGKTTAKEKQSAISALSSYYKPDVKGAVSTNDLQNTTEYNLPERKQTDYSGVQAGVTGTLSQAEKDKKAILEQNQKQTSDIAGLMKTIGQEEAMTTKVAEQEGAFEAKKAYDEYVSQIEAEDLALRRETDRIRENMSGASAFGVAAQIDEVTRKSLSKQADLAILQNASARRYETAYSIAKAKVEMELAPKKAELEGLKFIYDNNKAFQTAEYSSLLNRKEKELEQEQKDKEASNEMIVNAIQGKAPASLISKAQQMYKEGKSKTEIASVLGNYGMSEGERIDNKIKEATLANIYSQISERKNPALSPTEQAKVKEVSAQEKTKVDTFSNVAILADKLINDPSLKRGVGLSTYTVVPGTKAYDFKQTANQLINTLAAANLDKMKGAMSDKDIQFLRNIESNLALGMSEQGFKDELTRIKTNVTNKLKEDYGVDFKISVSDLSNDELLNLPTQNEDNATFFNNL